MQQCVSGHFLRAVPFYFLLQKINNGPLSFTLTIKRTAAGISTQRDGTVLRFLPVLSSCIDRGCISAFQPPTSCRAASGVRRSCVTLACHIAQTVSDQRGDLDCVVSPPPPPPLHPASSPFHCGSSQKAYSHIR